MREIQFREALREAMSEEMRRDPNIFLMGEEVAEYNGAYKVSQGMLDEFGPSRVIDTPISELGFAGIGVGAAMVGLRPIIEFMTWNFSMVAIDQIINGASKVYSMSGGQFHVPVTFRGPSASAGQLGATHSQSFEPWLANMPGIYCVVPSTPAKGKGLLKSAIREDNPVLVFESEQMYNLKGPVPEPDAGDYLIPLGVADVARSGTDVTLVTYGKMFHVCTDAADYLQKEGIHVELIDLQSVRPLDYETVLASVRKTNRCVVVEEAWPLASISSEIAYWLQRYAFDYLDAPVVRVTGADVPMPFAGNLIEEYLPNAQRVVQAVNYVRYR